MFETVVESSSGTLLSDGELFNRDISCFLVLTLSFVVSAQTKSELELLEMSVAPPGCRRSRAMLRIRY